VPVAEDVELLLALEMSYPRATLRQQVLHTVEGALYGRRGLRR